MNFDGYRVVLNSYDARMYRTISRVTVECSNYETFKKIVDVVKPILEEEDVPKDK